jgi:hypothetical protein
MNTRLAAGLLIMAARAAASGASQAPPSPETVVLPPFMVEDRKVEGVAYAGPEWLHAQVPGFEILSACAAEESSDFVRGLMDRRLELTRLVPDDFLLHTELPTTLILYPASLKQSMDDQMMQQVKGIALPAPAPSRFSPMNDLRLSEPDSSSIFVMLEDWDWQNSRWKRDSGLTHDFEVVNSPAYVRFLLESRTPTVPDWYVAGVTRLYGTMLFQNLERPTIALGAYMRYAPAPRHGFDSDPWISAESATALRANSGASRPLVPMGDLLVARVPAGRSEEYRRVWAAESELFVRFAVTNRVQDGQEKLRRLVAAASERPMTEALFRSCFDMGYADALEALNDYLPVAVGRAFEEEATDFPAGDPIDFQPATPRDIRRIKGEWARRALSVVRTAYPLALPLYVEEARKLLQGAYDAGERDPRLVASLALFRIENGDVKAGRALLESSPEVPSCRPAAGLALAELRLSEALKGPRGPDGTLGEDQASAVVAAVQLVRSHAPPLEEAYVAAARALEHLKREPTPEERALVEEGVRLFPRNPKLAVTNAAWSLRAGELDLAGRQVELGLWEVTEPSARKRLEELAEIIRSAPARPAGSTKDASRPSG